MAGAGVWLGCYLSDGSVAAIEIYMASLVAALVCAGGNAMNDVVDLESDMVNHPKRPLPNDELPLYFAILTAGVLNSFALTIAFFLNWAVLAIIILSMVFLFAYNFKLKSLPLAGNLVISFLAGATFIVGGLISDGRSGLLWPGPFVPAIFAFLFHLGREIIKDVADYDGDIKAGHKTFPTMVSLSAVMLTVSVIYAALVILTLLPVCFHWYSPWYVYLAILLVDMPLSILIIYLWRSDKPVRFMQAGRILKLLMLFGLVAFFLGKY